MKELTLSKRIKAVKLFLNGYTYDEVADRVGIAKGSVVNIIDEFRDGALPPPPDMAEYIDELRHLVVDLKKHHTTVAQARSYLRLHIRLQEMGVDSEEADKWLDISQDIASPNATNEQFVSAALELARVTVENNMSYESVIRDYGTKLREMKALDVEIERKQEELNKLKEEHRKEKQQGVQQLESMTKALETAQETSRRQEEEAKRQLDEHLIQNRLSWDKANTVIAILNRLLDERNLTKNEIHRISKDIREARSLWTTCKRLEKKRAGLQARVDKLAREKNELANTISELDRQHHQCQQRLRTKGRAEEELDLAIRSKSKDLRNLNELIANNIHDIFVAYLILKFLVMPNQLNTYELDRLVDLMIAIRQTRAGIRPKRIVGFDGKTVCACEVPKMFTSFDENETRIEEARDRFAAFIRPIIEDRFVSSWAHQALKTECECLKASLSLIRGVKK